MTLHGVGIDVVDTARFTRLISSRGDAFTRRWFTPDEVEEIVASGSPDATSREAASRYAAKEAVWKALGPGQWTGPLPWRDISVTRDGRSGRWSVSLGGRAAELCEERGVSSLSVSICAGDPYAMAFAFAALPDARA